VTKYQEKARSTYRAGDSIDEFWHPEIIAECMVMNEEREAEMRQSKAQIKKVVESVDDLEKEFQGCIALRFGFRGSIREGRAATKQEVESLLSKLPEEDRKKVLAELKNRKRLLGEKGFAKWENLKAARSKWVEQIKGYGIPFVVDGMTVVRIERIPEIEDLLDLIEGTHGLLVEELFASYTTRPARRP
jgi:hypothetical protein